MTGGCRGWVGEWRWKRSSRKSTQKQPVASISKLLQGQPSRGAACSTEGVRTAVRRAVISGSRNSRRRLLAEPDLGVLVFMRARFASLGSPARVAYASRALAGDPLCAGGKAESSGAVWHGSMLKGEFSGPGLGPWHLTELRLVPRSPPAPLWGTVLTSVSGSSRNPIYSSQGALGKQVF